MARHGLRILDSDMHVIEPHDLWLERLEEPDRERAPQLEPMPGSGAWRCEGRSFPAFWDHARRAELNRERYDLGDDRSRRDDADAGRAQGSDAKAQLLAMDVEGVDVAATFGTIGSHLIAVDEMEPAFADCVAPSTAGSRIAAGRSGLA